MLPAHSRRAFAAALGQQREALAVALRGIDDADDRRTFAAWLLTRLLFVACVQGRGLLGGDSDFLRTQWRQRPHGYYRAFLRPLVAALATPPERRDVESLGCDVPFLGALIPPHPLELVGKAPVDVPDEACALLLDFLADWQWQLGDALGDANEQFSSQKPTGVYYTADDVAAYICRTTIIPALCDRAQLALAPLDLPATIELYVYPEVAQGALLANESERERACRHARHQRVLARAGAGGIATIDDALSANLDLERLIAGLIAQLDPAAVGALYGELAQLRVLDPTCGAGALLVAALRVLAPIYAAVFERMAALVAQGAPGSAPLAAVLARAEAGAGRVPNAARAIIARNLHGVDLSPEAAAVCRLRLLLELVRAHPASTPIEPLVGCDETIRAGNALVGYGWRAGAAGNDALSRALAQEHGNATGDERAYGEWAARHRPLHWCAAFAAAQAQGGFDAIIGNPPYVAYSAAQEGNALRGYRTAASGNLYALVVERALTLLRAGGRCGVVVPVASVATDGMAALQQLYEGCAQWHSHYAVRPGKLFAGVDMNLTISLLKTAPAAPQRHSTGYRRWSARGGERAQLFATLAYEPTPRLSGMASAFPKFGEPIETRILGRMLAHGGRLGDYAAPGGTTIFYHSGGRYWRKALLERRSSHFKPLCVRPAVAPLAFALLNSQLFYWYWIAHSNCMDVVGREVLGLPVFALDQPDAQPYAALNAQLLLAYAAGSRTRVRRGTRISTEETNVDARQAKPLIDAIDALLARDYGLDDDELDFVVSYDSKFRTITRE